MMGKTGEIQLSVLKTNASDFHFLNSLKSLLHLKAHSLDKFCPETFWERGSLLIIIIIYIFSPLGPFRSPI